MAARSLSTTLKGYGRGLAGGLLFSLPALYTMEIWWQGYIAPPGRLLAVLLGTFVLLVAYAYYDGLRPDATLAGNVLEAFEALALGVIVAAVVLKLAGQLPAEASAYEIVGKLIKESSATAIGIAVGSAQLGASDERDGNGANEKQSGWQHEIAFSVLGAFLVISSVAPTEEVIRVAVEAGRVSVLLVALLSFLIALAVVSYVEFRGSSSMEGETLRGGPLASACVTYACALVVSAGLLWAFGRFEAFGVSAVLDQVVFLAFPGALGAAAGRLLL